MRWKQHSVRIFNGFPHPHRPLKNSSDISLMDVTHNDWEEDEPSDAKRFRVRIGEFYLNV